MILAKLLPCDLSGKGEGGCGRTGKELTLRENNLNKTNSIFSKLAPFYSTDGKIKVNYNPRKHI